MSVPILRFLSFLAPVAVTTFACVEPSDLDTESEGLIEDVTSPSVSSDNHEVPDVTPKALTQWPVPFINQRLSTGIGESACGPTTLAMLVNYHYPSASLTPSDIYHSGTQNYRYYGPARGYANISAGSGWSTDPNLSAVSSSYWTYYTPSSPSRMYTGAVRSALQSYLEDTWDMTTSVTSSINTVYSAIQSGPVVIQAYGQGNSGWGHYVLLIGIDDRGTSSRSDDVLIVHDPYDRWGSWDTTGNARRLSYSEFFVRGRYGSPWFRNAIVTTPNGTAAERANTVVVDSSHNSTSGTSQTHEFQVDNVTAQSSGTDVWRSYYGPYGGGYGQWVFPNTAGRSASWTPSLTASGRYRVDAMFYSDSGSGNVTYSVHGANGSQLASSTISQQSSSAQHRVRTIAADVTLTSGSEVRASNIARGTNVDAIRFVYLGPASSGTGNCPTSGDGAWDYCSVECPCDYGDGDCDADDECQAGLTCRANVGHAHGYANNGIDVCEGPTSSSCNVGSPGGWDYVYPGCLGDVGDGDCDSNSDCQAGLVCTHNTGARWGFGSAVDVCDVPPAMSTCHVGSPGDWSYCSASCPCGPSMGDCDSNAECVSGTRCVSNVGARYGFGSGVDVCE